MPVLTDSVMIPALSCRLPLVFVSSDLLFQKACGFDRFYSRGVGPLHLTGFQTDSLYLVQHISCFAFLPPTPLGFQTLQADQ